MSVPLNQLWTYSFPSEPRGLSLAREPGRSLVWCANDWLYLLNPRGQLQAQVHFPETIACAASADTGSLIIVAGQQGLLRSFAPDLSPRGGGFPNLPGGNAAQTTSLALDPFGQTLARADNQAQLHFRTSPNQPPVSHPCPRPLTHLAFVPTDRRLVACADSGLILAFDTQGKILWRDAPFSSIGSLSVDGAGENILVASFTDGIQRWNKEGKKQDRIATPEPCRLVCQSFESEVILAAGLEAGWWAQRGKEGKVSHFKEDAPITALACCPLGDRVWLLRGDKKLVCYELQQHEPGFPRE